MQSGGLWWLAAIMADFMGSAFTLGMAVAGWWGYTIAFLFPILLDWFRVTAIVSLVRALLLTWSWICIVRRHLKEVSEIVQRPKLQTFISIATAHPFAPRPALVDIPVLACTGPKLSPHSLQNFHF